MKFKIYLFISLFVSCYAQSQNDSLVKTGVSVDSLYRYNFSVYDSLKIVNDTIYLAPILVEPKILVQDSVAVDTKSDNFKKVTISTYEVSHLSKKRNMSYFLINHQLDMDFDKEPKSDLNIPYQVLNTVYHRPSYWTKKNEIGLDLNQGTFTNWSAGGNNAISGILKIDLLRKYERGRTLWLSELKIRYGLQKQSEQEIRKTDDVLSLNSSFGYKTSVKSKWSYSVKFSLNSQFSDGFKYPDVNNPISRAFAPAYVFLGIGSEYVLEQDNTLFYISPATWKATFVLDKKLANQGAFGLPGAIENELGVILKNGRRSRHEIGILFSGQYKKNLAKNILLETRLNLYTDYLNNFGNIDVDWQLQVEMKITNYVRATIGGFLIYDDDIRNKKTVDGKEVLEGPRVQFKQLLGFGIIYSFK